MMKCVVWSVKSLTATKSGKPFELAKLEVPASALTNDEKLMATSFVPEGVKVVAGSKVDCVLAESQSGDGLRVRIVGLSK